MIRLRRGAITIEYVCLVAILIAALIGASAFIKRALCGSWREVGDSFGYGRQYSID